MAETEFIASACATFGEISCEKGAYQDMHIGSKLGLVIIQGRALVSVHGKDAALTTEHESMVLDFWRKMKTSICVTKSNSAVGEIFISN